MLSDLIGKVFFASSFFSLNVDDDFISLHGVVIYFPDFDLPGSDAVDVIKYVFEIIEVNQCAFDLSDLQAVDVPAQAVEKAEATAVRLPGKALA